MYITLFTDLPDLVILNILDYLSSFDAIQAFYNIDDNNNNDRILNLLIENGCFSTLHDLRLPLFNFVCDYVLPRIGAKLSHLTLYDNQLQLARKKEILSYLTNITSLDLKNLVEIKENDDLLSYFLHKQIENLTIEFVSEHHIDAQAYVCEQFIFNNNSENLIHCHLINSYGIQLRHFNLFPNQFLENLTIQLKELSDLHILFDHLLNIKILNIEICQWTIDDIKYDYQKLSRKFPNLIEFSLKSEHVLTFKQLLTILENLIHLKKLSFIYRNYDERGIDLDQFERILSKNLIHLIHLNFLIKFIYFNLNSKQTFENKISFKQQWNIYTYNNLLNKYYLAYTQPFSNQTYSISTDILFQDDPMYFPSVTNLSLTIHKKQISFSSIVRLLNENFPSITHLHLIDSFEILEENPEADIKLFKICSFDGSDLKIPNLLLKIFRIIPNLNDLKINLDLLMNCDMKKLFFKNQIKSVQLLTNHIDQINKILIYFPYLEQLKINTKKQSKQYEKIFIRSIFNWFQICSNLYRIDIQAHKLADLFYLVNIETSESVHIQYSNEFLTLWI